jgi:hypothetical protein
VEDNGPGAKQVKEVNYQALR